MGVSDLGNSDNNDQSSISNNLLTKYYDNYSTGSCYDYNRRILGDATGEINGWSPIKYIAHSDKPWVFRGGGYYENVKASFLIYSMYYGNDAHFVSSRPTIPQF